jgi:hypothetical protein
MVYAGHQTITIPGRRCNHLWHLTLTLCTVGLWFPVWLIAALRPPGKNVTITVPIWREETTHHPAEPPWQHASRDGKWV